MSFRIFSKTVKHLVFIKHVCLKFYTLMACSHCTETGTGPGQGPGMGTMGYYILCRTVHTAQGQGQEPDLLSPIVLLLVPVPVPFPVPVQCERAIKVIFPKSSVRSTIPGLCLRIRIFLG